MYKYFEKIEEIDVQSEIIKLQKDIIRCMYIEIQNIEDRNELINFIYKYRYYNWLPIKNSQNIFNTNELKKANKKLVESLIKNAIQMKAINEILTEEDKNIELTEKLFLSNIIRLQDINIKITKEKENLYMTIYDEEIEDSKIELKNIKKEDLKIKLGKKTKLFI